MAIKRKGVALVDASGSMNQRIIKGIVKDMNRASSDDGFAVFAFGSNIITVKSFDDTWKGLELPPETLGGTDLAFALKTLPTLLREMGERGAMALVVISDFEIQWSDIQKCKRMLTAFRKRGWQTIAVFVDEGVFQTGERAYQAAVKMFGKKNVAKSTQLKFER